MSTSTSGTEALRASVRLDAPGLAELLAAGALAVLAGPSPLAQRLAESSLAVHMLVEHGLLLAAGALAAVGLQRSAWVAARLRRLGRWRLAGAVLFLGVLVAWHVPVLFGAAVTTPTVHAAMHLTYVGAGLGLVVALPAISAFGRVLLFLGLQSVMAVLAVAMYTGAVTYPGYDPAQTAPAGVAMVAGMQLLLPLVVFTR
jgi:cytochrome c oxidase assembly factor CtaG